MALIDILVLTGCNYCGCVALLWLRSVSSKLTVDCYNTTIILAWWWWWWRKVLQGTWS